MRADRLVAVLLLLQARGRVTAAEVAQELEVSERTARRDLEALAMAGIPVYSQAGRGGGWSLVGGARTDLSGLTAAEAQALFMVAGPSAAATPKVKAALRKLVRALPEPFRAEAEAAAAAVAQALFMVAGPSAAATPKVKAALRKLVRALPEPFRAEAEAAASAVVLDPLSWDREAAPAPPFLDVLQRAVVDGVQVRLRYAAWDRPETERVVHPLGLVAKASVWYLVAGTDAGRRTFRVSRVRAVVPTGDPVERPEGFDLAEEWKRIVEALDERRVTYRATLRSSPEAIPWLRSMFGTRMTVGDALDDGRVEVSVRSWSAHALSREIAGLVEYVEVLEPEARAELASLGAALSSRYGADGRP